MSFKIHLLNLLTNQPYGGSNQFLRNIKANFIARELYTDSPQAADIIFTDSYQTLDKFIDLKKQYPHKHFALRLGPIFHLHRGARWKILDKLVIDCANTIADSVIFQSHWSHQESVRLGFANSQYTIIGNAADPNLFYPKKSTVQLNQKVRLVAASWSSNQNKGFDIFQYLDDQLDFEKFEMTFIGNTPVAFKNIQVIEPLHTSQLAQVLRQHDIFITGTKDDACSNSISEALSSGLPVVALKSGGNEEIMAQHGALFTSQRDVLSAINTITQDLETYRSRISIPTLSAIADQYVDIFKAALGRTPQHPTTSELISLKAALTLFQTKDVSWVKKLKAIKKFFFMHYKYTMHRLLLEQLIQQHAARLTGAVLDIGSKNRRYDKLIPGTVTAIDIKANEKHAVIQGDIEQKLKFEDNSFDSVVCLEVFQYITKHQHALDEIHRLLKPGGSALISMPFMYHEHGDKMRLTHSYLISVPFLYHEHGDKMRLTHSYLESLLQQFGHYEFTHIGNAWTVIWDILWKKVMLGKPRLVKLLGYVMILPVLVLIKLFKCDKISSCAGICSATLLMK